MNRESEKILLICGESDNVGVLMTSAQKGQVILAESVNGKAIEVHEDIPRGHKIAIREIPKGSGIVKYGVQIGCAKEIIHTGMWVHVHNVIDNTEELCEAFYKDIKRVL